MAEMKINITKVADEIIKKLNAEGYEVVKHGEWNGYTCSECNVCADYFISGDFYFDEKPNFCPNCGARMDGDNVE